MKLNFKKFFSLFLTYIVLITPSSLVLANDECSAPDDVDLRSSFCPLRDQDSIGWCYSFAAADLLTYALHKQSK